MLRLWIAGAVAIVPFLLHCSIGRSCTARGCTSGAELQTTLPVVTTDLDKVTIKACKNGTCWTAVPSVTHDPCGAGVRGCSTSAGCALVGAPVLTQCSLYPVGQPDRSEANEKFAQYTLTVSYRVISSAERDALKDGDTYSVEAVMNGATVAKKMATATYTTDYPNGPDCDGDDGFCRAATLK